MILGCAEPITCLELMVYRKSLPFGLSQNHFKTFQIISWRVFGLFSRPRESLVEAATKGFGAPSDAFAPNFAMRRRFAAGTFARAIFYRAHEMPFGLKESPVEISVANPGAPSLFGRTRRYRSSHKR